MRKISKWMVAGITSVLVLVGAGCAKCVKSHQETRHVAAKPTYSYRTVGDRRVRYQSGVRAAHDETFTVCDQYEGNHNGHD